MAPYWRSNASRGRGSGPTGSWRTYPVRSNLALVSRASRRQRVDGDVFVDMDSLGVLT